MGIGRVRGFVESGTLFVGQGQITQDLNYVPQVVTPVENASAMPCNIYRGDRDAAFEVGALGRVSTQASYGYFDKSFLPWLLSGRYVFISRTGETFRIMGIPSMRSSLPRLAKVKCLLDLVLIPPAGIPQVRYETTPAYGVGSCYSTDTYIPA